MDQLRSHSSVSGLAAAASIALSIWAAYRFYSEYELPENYARRAERILKSTPLIDGHNDLPYLLRIELQNKINDDKFTFRHGMNMSHYSDILVSSLTGNATNLGLSSHTDLQRLQQGRVGGQFWSVFMESPDTKHIDDPSHIVRDTLEQIDVARRFIDAVPELQFCSTPGCAVKAFKAGKIASMIGAEGLHQTGSSIAVIRQLWNLGVRYITITHNADNAYATAASTVTSLGEEFDAGLSPFGAMAIREMNRLGMMVDLSHTSHRTMRQILEISRSPVIFSHSTCYELANNYRNAPDDVIRQLKTNGGVLMVMFVKRFLNATEPDKANVETVVDHIMHIVRLAGWDHVGIGGDFDGTVTLANGIHSVADYPRLLEAVMRRGATDRQIRKLIGENILR